MTVSIMKVGYLFRWLVVIAGKCNGGMAGSWDDAFAEATKAAEHMGAVA